MCSYYILFPSATPVPRGNYFNDPHSPAQHALQTYAAGAHNLLLQVREKSNTRIQMNSLSKLPNRLEEQKRIVNPFPENPSWQRKSKTKGM